ncbi:MAG: D-alanyl-D-alanine carboxypeptidase family protein [Clostridia bacterium]|nr:D-alanyl-D-alanine carboxypeptidase family protein [Clostridia bacterium]
MKKKQDRYFYIFAALVALALLCVILIVAVTNRGGNGSSAAPSGGAASDVSPAAGAESGDASDYDSPTPETSGETSGETSAGPSTETSSLPEDESSAPEQKEKPLLINKDHGLPEDYDPGEMVDILARKDRHFQLAHADMKLQTEVYEALDRMCADAEAQGVTGYILTDSFRPREEQERLYSEMPAGIAAPPGYSEHETGLAFDISAYSKNGDFGETPQFEWLYAHCAEYGFILRYPQGKEDITGYSYEPWHYRYVGVEIAKEIMSAGMTLEEYCGD